MQQDAPIDKQAWMMILFPYVMLRWFGLGLIAAMSIILVDKAEVAGIDWWFRFVVRCQGW